MYAAEAWKEIHLFLPYLDNTKSGGWFEKGLVPDAPPEIIRIFEKFKEAEEIAKEQGDII